MVIKIRRGDIVLANLEPVVGSEQGSIRPVLIIQNDISNQYSPTTIIAPITSKVYEKEFPTNVKLSKQDSGLDKNSNVLLNQIRTIDKSRIRNRISSLDSFMMDKIRLAIRISLDLE